MRLVAALVLAASAGAAHAEPEPVSSAVIAAEPVPGPEAPGDAAREPATVGRVYLRDGTSLLGTLEGRDADSLLLRTIEGARVRIPRDQVRAVVHAEGARPSRWTADDPAAARLLGAPTALALSGGEAAVGFEGSELRATFAPWTGVALSLGGVLPVGNTPDAGMNGTARVTAATRAWRGLRAMAGVQGTFERTGRTALLLAAATWGTPERHVTVSAGPPFAGAAAMGLLGDVAWAVGGKWAFSPRVALVTEHWLSRAAGPTSLHDGVALRLRLGPAALELGLLASPTARTASPWAAFTLRGVAAESWWRP